MKTHIPRLVAGLLLLVSTLVTLQVSAANVLLIIADDLGIDASPGYTAGNDKPSMPNVQALADSGVRFNNVWAQPYCSPTRATILSGRYGHRTLVRYPGDLLVNTTPSIPDQLPSNVAAAAFGKWHLAGSNSGSTNGATHAVNVGFDRYAGATGGSVENYTNWTKYTKIGSGTATSAKVTNYATTNTANDALNWIQDQGNNDWFAWVAFNAGHTPLHNPPASLLSSPLPASPTSRQQYKAMLEAMDNRIGALINGIDDSVLANTTIIFIGDNGTPGAVKSGGLRASKGTLYEGGVRVPLVISGAGVAGSNRIVSNLVNTSDLYRTITDLFGVSATNVNGGEDSRTLTPYLDNQIHPAPRAVIYADLDTPSTPLRRAVRNARYKLINSPSTPNNDEFYDLQSDPQESQNLLNGSLNSTQSTQLKNLRSIVSKLN